MYLLNVSDHFSAAHRLCGYEGACSNLHGHNW
ncbi:MAG: 6-carboxytetrahydropterin synthase, partial [Candidatus Cloacimonetes bacterium]|nr:6-carboxytetrahydropterin synthase [Candidatus Cloacimonadota bacterium]